MGKALLSLVLVWLCTSVATPALADLYIRVRPNVLVTPGAQVTLEHLVDPQGLNRELLGQLRAVAVSMAPAASERQTLNDARVTSLIRPIVQNVRRDRKLKIHLIVPKTVTIASSRGELTTELVRQELAEVWQALCGLCQIEFIGLTLPQQVQVQDWRLQVRPELPSGSFNIPLQLTQLDGKVVQTWVSGRLIIKRKVPVANRVLNLRERVTPKDFDWQFRDTSYAIDGIPTTEDIIGRRLRQGLRVGEILWKGTLERERAVRRGDVVQIRSTHPTWEVSLSAIAQEDGFIGDVINLKNMKSNTLLMGHVTNPGEVELR